MPDILPLLRRRYPQVAKDLLEPLLELLRIGRASCDGDLDRVLIVLVLALRTAEDRRFADLDYEKALSGAIDHYPSLLTNVRSIAGATGIPKESVRRKVAALIEAGWIRRVDGSLSLAPQASRSLTALREQLFQLADRYRRTIAALEAQEE